MTKLVNFQEWKTIKRIMRYKIDSWAALGAKFRPYTKAALIKYGYDPSVIKCTYLPVRK